MKNILIRKETEKDYKQTEYMVMRAFWNLHGPGCNEHLLVRKMRSAGEYLPELSRVAECEGRIVGAIFYSVATVTEGDVCHEVLTFGPLAVEPTMCHEGIGRMLLEETLGLAGELGYPGIVILGEPDYYPKRGFTSTKPYEITSEYGYCDALMAYKLNDSFDQIHGMFQEGPVFSMAEDEEELRAINEEFPYHKPLKLACQWLHREKLGQICEVKKKGFVIRFWEKELPAKLAGSFYNEKKELPVVGDYVTFLYNPMGDSSIVSVCERKSLLKRPDQSGHAIGYVKCMQEQVMVSNFDYVFIVSSLNDNYNFNRIARYVSITLQGGGCPVVILTKADLCSNSGRYIREIEELSDKIRVHAISALYGIGLEELGEYLKPGNCIAILGSSGVGKSTLVNTLVGKEVLRTSAIREEDSKGRHTTTTRQMIYLDNGTCLIDTPGMRELGMCDVEEGIAETFQDIRELEENCRFRDCRHMSEPGCAVRRALEDGSLSSERYELYLGLQEESNKSARMKEIAKMRRTINKNRH